MLSSSRVAFRSVAPTSARAFGQPAHFERAHVGTAALPSIKMSLEHPLHNVDGEYVDIWAQPLAVIKLFPFMRLPEIMRRVVLEFVLTVAPPEQTWTFGWRSRLRYSAATSLSTVLFHARAIKAVCKAIAIDVSVIERRDAKPEAWLKGLWKLDASSRTDALAQCRYRAGVARKCNLALEMYQRLGRTSKDLIERDIVFQRPKHWQLSRAEAAKIMFDEVRSDPDADDSYHFQNKDVELVCAHGRHRPTEEVHALAPVDAELLVTLADTAAASFVKDLRRRSWPLLCHNVSLVYHARDGAFVADDSVYDMVDAALEAFFGAETMRGPLWNQTRIRDRYHRLQSSRGKSSRFLTLTDAGEAWEPRDLDAVATIDILFDAHARGEKQIHWGNELPSLMWIDPVDCAECRGGSWVCTDAQFWMSTSGIHLGDPILPQSGEATLFIPLFEDMFEARVHCTIAGLS